MSGARRRAVRWLVGDSTDRERFAVALGRLTDVCLISGLMTAVNLQAVVWYGLFQLATVVVAVGTMAICSAWVRRSATPEIPAVVAFTALLTITAAAIAGSGGADSPLLVLLLVPVAGQASCFRTPVYLAGMSLAGLLAVVVCLVPWPSASEGGGPAVLYVLSLLTVLWCLASTARTVTDSQRTALDDAAVDSLTGLRNRAALARRCGPRRTGARAPIGLVMCDIDNFKQINDTFGHGRGDEVLRAFADRLQGLLREDDEAYRIGGEEFALWLPGADHHRAVAVAERIREGMAAAPVAGLAVTLSAGVVSFEEPPATLGDLFAPADVLLYRAKHSGRNRVAAQLS